MEFCNPLTVGGVSEGTYALYPAYCRILVISEGERTVMVATDLLKQFRETMPGTVQQKVKHCKVLRGLTNIIFDYGAPKKSDQRMDAKR